MQEIVESGQLAGAATLVWRHGAEQTFRFGRRDIKKNLAVERDTMFRIASMTKPITSVAALMLVDDGRIALNDPVTRYAPEFSHMRVLRSPNGSLRETDSAERPLTFGDLLTHRAGLTYADFHRGPITQAYRDALGSDIDSRFTPDEWMARLAQLPLIGQPGAMVTYGCATDLLGFLLARIEGEPLGAILRRRIFDPLGMKDTGFLVPRDQRDRRAAAYGFDEEERLIRRTTWGGGVVAEERPDDMEYESGGAGLWSTAPDYVRFARLFLGDGSVDGVRLLRPETLRMMMTNQLTDTQRGSVLLGQRPFAAGRGFGLGVSVVEEPDRNDLMRRGGAGSVSWPGAFGGWWQADPNDGSVLIFLAHNMVDLAQMSRGVGLGVWAAVEAFQTLAAGL